MKIKLFTKRPVRHVSKGFALIATITLMMLLALLSVGLLTIASSQVRISEKQLFAAEAKSLARFSLEVALGQLQCELGPDQRVSANSGILSSGTSEGNAPYILGVWNSWDSWLNTNNSEGMNISATYDTGRKSMFRRWLISDPDLRRLSSLEAGKNLLGKRSLSNQNFRSVALVGPGTIGTPVGARNQDKKEIYARMVRVDDSSKTTGLKKNANSRKYIAWWVTGENQKARINLMPHASEESTDALTVLRSTWDTPGPDLESLNLSSVMTAGSGNDMSAVRKLISLDSLLANNKNGRLKDLGDVYHDISLVSSSLLTDSKFGGLKKDLNIMFSQEKLPEEFRGDTADIGLRPYTSEDGNPSDQNRPIGSWNQLYLWANVWDSSTKREGQDASATLQWNGSAPSTLIAADSAASMEMMDNRYTYMRHPILLRFYSFVGLNYVKHGNKHPNRGGWIDFRIAVIPVYVWWNPYNVDMKLTGANGGVWGAYFGEHRFMPLLLSHNVKFAWNQLDENALSNYGESCLIPYLNTSYNNRQVADFGASFRTTAKLNSDGSTVKGEPSTLKAGEIVVFAQPVVSNIANGNEVYKTKPNSGDFKPDRFPLKEGWSQEPGQVSSYAVNLTDGVRYELLDGSGYNQVGIAKASVIFAEDTSRLNGTPDNHVLAVKYGDKGASKALGTFVMGAGLMDPNKMNSSSSLNGKSTAEIEIFSKTMPAILNLNWGAWEKPLVDQIKLPAEMWERNEGTNEEAKKAGEYGTPSLDSTFVAYYGVSVKWGKPPVIGAYPEGKDYRAKTWQHSSPLFWGGQMPTASELGRLYSPYQFEVKNANSDFFPITISNILSNDGTRLSFGGPGAEQVNKIVAAELPFQQLLQPGRLCRCRLTPDGTGATPGRPSPNASPTSPGRRHRQRFCRSHASCPTRFSPTTKSWGRRPGDFWDHGLMINDASGTPGSRLLLAARLLPALGARGKGRTENRSSAGFLHGRFSNRASGIANRRFMPDLQGKPRKLSSKNSPGRTRAALRLAPHRRRRIQCQLHLPARLGSHPLGPASAKSFIPENGGSSVLGNSQTAFSRFRGGQQRQVHVDDYGSIGVTPGHPGREAMAWSDLRTPERLPDQVPGPNMVAEVEKGPFLNMSDFVNRRLQSG